MLGERHRRHMREIAATLSPARRRWIRFLQALPLDPAVLKQPVASPGAYDFIICGSPRTGTTLLCAALFQPPAVVTVMEPWDGMRLPPADLFSSLRHEIAETRSLRRGRLDVAALQREGSTRWCAEGDTPVSIPTDEDFLLGVKWPAYWQYLELLQQTKFLVCLRHPAEVVASYGKTGGRVGLGLEYDTKFNRTLNAELRRATKDPEFRRVMLYEYIHRRIIPHLHRPNVMPVRYERWFRDRAGLLADISAFLGTDIRDIPVELRAPKHNSVPTRREAALLRKHCSTASELGYDLGSEAAPGHELA